MLKRYVLHPILFSIFPVLSLVAYNLGQFEYGDTWRSFLISLLIGLSVWFVTQLLLRDWATSGFYTTLLLFFLFGYGHIYNAVQFVDIGSFHLGRHRYLLPLLLGLLIFAAVRIYRKHPDYRKINEFLNTVGLVLMILPIYQIASFQIETGSVPDVNEESVDVGITQGGTSSTTGMPDVYFIVLDAYGRQDILESLYGFDNSAFIAELEDLGFYVPVCSQSNYPETQASVGTAVNFNYLQYFWPKKNYKAYTYYRRIQNSQVRKLLESNGYITVDISSGNVFTEITDADVYLSGEDPDVNLLKDLVTFDNINDFEDQLLETTVVMALNDMQVTSREYGFLRRRAEVNFALDTLPDIPDIPGPKFVFVHIVSPHRPFVFGPNGEEILDSKGKVYFEEDYATGYTNQVSYLNSRLPSILQAIIEKSAVPPIIIMMGDHGPNVTQPEIRAANMEAIYLPGGGSDLLYPTITPINIFRIVLSYYFGYDLPLVDDIHYRSSVDLWPDEYPIIPNTPNCLDQ